MTPTGPACTTCRKAPRRKGQRTCKDCHKADMVQRRKEAREMRMANGASR